MWHDVISVEALAERKEYGFTLPPQQDALEAFLLWTHAGIRAYINACPHQRVNLNWSPHQFLDRQQAFVICSMHGALFVPDSGLCVHGPCLDEQLSSLPVRVISARVQVFAEPGQAA